VTTPSIPVLPHGAAAAPHHGRRVIVAWLVLSAIATPLVGFLLGPAIRPGHSTVEAAQQVRDNTVLTVVITPVFCLLAVFFAYALVVFRARGAAVEDGPADRGDSGIQVLWIVITSAIVLFLAGFGTFELLQTGAGGGQGPSPVAVPSGSAHDRLQVQVIGQQWAFTYRYPSYGGLETPHLVLPAGKTIEFHVTSLDAVHSFWAYELGVKADANPGVDNVAYVTLKGPRRFQIRCAELGGLWHGYMSDVGEVVPPAQFADWIEKQQAEFAPVAKYLPPYAKTYLPDPQRRAG
jgi:cytochrome c oxidase subunit 2